jgi:hypothetical protein
MAYGGGYSSRGEDPDYRRESVYHFGNALSLFAQEIQQRQDQQRLLAQNEVQRFFREAQLDPSLAYTWGPDMVRRIGTQVPEAQYLVQAIQQRSQQAQQIRSGFQAYLGAVDTAKKHQADLQAAHDLMPDSYTVPSLFPESQGLPAAVPNTDKQALGQTIQGAAAIGPYRTAMNSLSAADEMNARLYLQANKLPAPPEMMGFDPKSLKSGDVGLIQLYMQMHGLTDPGQMNPQDPEVRQLFKQQMSGAEADKLTTTFQQNKSYDDYKTANQLDLMLKRYAQAQQLTRLSHGLTAAQEQANQKNRLNILSQEGKLMGVGDPGMMALSAANANLKDWQQKFTDTQKTIGVGGDPSVLQAMLRERPKPLAPGQSDAIADSISAEVAMGLLPAAQSSTEAGYRALGIQALMTPQQGPGRPVPPGSPPGTKAPPSPSSVAVDPQTALRGAISAGHRRLMAQLAQGLPDPQGQAAQRLMQNPIYAQAVQGGATPGQARAVLMNKAYDQVFGKTGDPMAALAAATGQPIPAPAVRTKIRAALRATVPGGGALPMGGMAGSIPAPAPEAEPEMPNASPPQDAPQEF